MQQLAQAQQMGSRWWNYAPPTTGITNSTADVAAKAAVAGERNYVSSMQLSVSVVLANATTIAIKSGSTILARFGLPVTAVGPQTFNFDPPLRGGVNEAINIAAETSFATGNVQVNLQGFTV